MKFGILYNIDYRPEVHGSSARYYGQILDQIQIIEELGFDSVWFGNITMPGIPLALRR